MKIPVIVVDDEQVDRYTARRRLDRHGGFGEIREAVSGDAFLDEYCTKPNAWPKGTLPMLILMDINMPGRDGFATVAELESRNAAGLAPPSLVVTMFTSSSSPRDRERASALRLVQGYAEKPLDTAGAEALCDLYTEFLRSKGMAA